MFMHRLAEGAKNDALLRQLFLEGRADGLTLSNTASTATPASRSRSRSGMPSFS
jgi:hypothetical protein